MARVLTVLAHGDTDGVSSAAVVKAALAGEYEAVRVYFTHTPSTCLRILRRSPRGMSTSSTWLLMRRPPTRCGGRSGATGGGLCI